MISFEQLSFWEKQTFLNQIDVVIVGSGIVGLSTAIHLKQVNSHQKIMVVERGYLPSGASTKNAGFACIGSASEIIDDLKTMNEETVWATVNKRWKGLQYLKELVGVDNLKFQSPGSYELFSANEQTTYHTCLDQLQVLNGKMEEITGWKSVYTIDENIVRSGGFSNFQYAIRNAAEGQINTGAMMQSLLQKAQSLGITLLNGIEVKSIQDHSLTTQFGDLQFKKLALCVNGLAAQFLQEDVQPARAQVIVTSPISNLPFQGTYHFDKGYYYFRNIGDRVLLGGGRNLNFEAEETDELNTSDQIINHLSSLLETHILPKSSFTIDHHWAGTMGIGKSKAPIVKQVGKTIYCGVRLGGMGVAIGSLVGKELAELMQNDWNSI